jgi:hypothetical protein
MRPANGAPEREPSVGERGRSEPGARTLSHDVRWLRRRTNHLWLSEAQFVPGASR